MRRLGALVVLFAASAAIAAATLYKVGDDVADATLATVDGKETKLSSYEGNVVLLYFYGAWARHAGEDAKQIDGVRKARAKQKLTVLGVARDAKPEEAKKFAEDNKLGFLQTLDPKSEFYGRFATKGLPWIAVLDAKRRLKYSAAGIDEEALDTALTSLLGAREGTPDKPPGKDGGGKK